MENCKSCLFYYEDINQVTMGTDFSSESIPMCDKIEANENEIFEEECIKSGKEIVTIDEVYQAFPEAVLICPFYRKRI